MHMTKIKDYRRIRGVTQEQLALHIGVSQNFLSELENGKYDIKLSLLNKIASVLDICPKELLVCSRDCNCNNSNKKL